MTWQWPNWRVSRNEIVQKIHQNQRRKQSNYFSEIAPENQFYKLELIINGSNNHISIGEGCWGSLKIIIDTDDTVVKIGKNCAFRGLESGLWERGSRLTIGDEVMAAKDSRMYVSDFHAIVDLESGNAINPGSRVTWHEEKYDVYQSKRALQGS